MDFNRSRISSTIIPSLNYQQHVYSSSHSRFLGATSKSTSLLLLQLCFLLCTTTTTTLSRSTISTAYPLFNSINLRVGAQVTNDTETGNPVNNYDQPLLLDVGQRTVVSSQDAALGTIMIIFGSLLVFFGYKLIRATLIIMGFITWAVVAVIIMAIFHWNMLYVFFHPNQYYFWVWFLSGLLGAVLSFRFWDIGVLFTGGFGGFSLAMGIIAACNYSLSSPSLYALLVCLVIVGALSTRFERVAVIFGTSFSGAFLLMYGVDEFVQVGYREMFVVFGFTGRMLSYDPNRQVHIMLACSLGLACLGIVLELIFHRTPLWMNRKVLFSICGQPFGKRPDQLEDQKLGHSTGSSRWNPFLAIYLCGKGKVAVEAPCRDGDGSQVNQNNEPIAVSANRFSTHEANPEANRSSVMTLGLPEEHYVLGLENFSDIETIAASNSGTLSKSSSNHVEERQGEQPVDVLLPMPAEVTIENIDLSEDTNNKDFTGPQFEAVTYQVAPERPS